MNLAVLDFETFYSTEYTLKKMTTEAYVRDPRYKTHCCAIKAVGDQSFPTEPLKTVVFDSFAGQEAALRKAASKFAVVCHNAKFDGLILAHHYGAIPAFWFDTLSMARLVFPHDKSHSLSALAQKFGLPEKTVPYNEFIGVRDLPPELYDKLAAGCAHDVELTWLIFQKLLPLVPKSELRVIDMTVRMFTEPKLRLDYPAMEKYYEQVKVEKEQVLESLGVTKEALQSSDKFAALLTRLGVEPPTKPSGTDPTKKIYAFAKTDEAMKALCEDEDERVSALCCARLGQKSTLNETRCERLLRMAERGDLTVPLRYYGAGASGRFSGEDSVNFQNFPRSGEIRNCLLAPPKHVLLVGDLSQVECRVLNWLAGEKWVLEAFQENRDLYSEIASKFYKRQITKADKSERGLGKQVELSCGFGSGGAKIAITARRGTYGPPVILTNEEGAAWRDLYRNTHPKVVQLWAMGQTMLQHLNAGTAMSYGPLEIKDHRIYLPGGVWLDYTNLTYEGHQYGKPDFSVQRRNGKSRIYGSKIIQNIVEALSRLILVAAMLTMQEQYKALMCTHDEAVFLVPEEQAEKAKEQLYKLLTTPPAWCADIPLDAEVGYDVRYSK